MRSLPWLKDREYPSLILSTRSLLEASGRRMGYRERHGGKEGVEGASSPGVSKITAWMAGGYAEACSGSLSTAIASSRQACRDWLRGTHGTPPLF